MPKQIENIWIYYSHSTMITTWKKISGPCFFFPIMQKIFSISVWIIISRKTKEWLTVGMVFVVPVRDTTRPNSVPTRHDPTRPILINDYHNLKKKNLHYFLRNFYTKEYFNDSYASFCISEHFPVRKYSFTVL